MGKVFSSLIPPDPLDEKNWNYEKCRCGDPHKLPIDHKTLYKLKHDQYEAQHPNMIATYRCQYVTDELLFDEEVPGHPELRKYWRSSSSGGRLRGWRMQYIACEECVGKNRDFFTHHSNGWKSHAKCSIEYEPISFH